MAKKIHQLLEKYEKYCPKCKSYQEGVWEVCNNCKTPLIDAKTAYKRNRSRKITVNILFIVLLISLTYGMQPAERVNYNNGIKLLFSGKFHDSKAELWKAFSANPICKPIVASVKDIKYKLTHRTVVFEIK